MTRSLSTPDQSWLEDQVREALRDRAASTPIGSHRNGHAEVPALTRPVARPSRRRYLLAGAAAATVVVLVVALAQLAPTSEDVETSDLAPSAPTGAILPSADVPRLLIDGATFQNTEGEGRAVEPAEAGVVGQSFRRPGRLDGPMIFLTTLHPWNPATFGLLDDEFGDPIEVRGQTGYIAQASGEQGVMTLSVELGDGDALHTIAIGITDAEAVAFLNGLVPNPDGRWASTATPDDLVEVSVAPDPADGWYYGGAFDLPAEVQAGREQAGNNTVDVNLYQDGFESRLGDRVASTTRPVEMVTVDGFPAALGAYNPTDWWVLLEPEPGRALELRIPGDRSTVHWVLSHARFVDEAAWDAAAE
jgi:hypothetical protein